MPQKLMPIVDTGRWAGPTTGIITSNVAIENAGRYPLLSDPGSCSSARPGSNGLPNDSNWSNRKPNRPDSSR